MNSCFSYLYDNVFIARLLVYMVSYRLVHLISHQMAFVSYNKTVFEQRPTSKYEEAQKNSDGKANYAYTDETFLNSLYSIVWFRALMR